MTGKPDDDMTAEYFLALLAEAEPVVILPYLPDWAPGPHNDVYYDEKYECWQLTEGSWAHQLDEDGDQWPRT